MPIFDDILIFAYAAGDTETEAIADYETGGRIFEKQNKEKRNTRAKDAELTIIWYVKLNLFGISEMRFLYQFLNTCC